MTAGRGFIGLAAMIVGRWTPIGAFGAALLFASSARRSARRSRSARRAGQLGDVLTQLPAQFFDALPYIVTIIVLAGRRRAAASRRPPTASRTSARRRRDRRRRATGRRRPSAIGRRPSSTSRRAAGPSRCSTTAGCAELLASRPPASPSSALRPIAAGRRTSVMRYLRRTGYECVPVNPNGREVLGVATFADARGGRRRDRPVRHRRRLPAARVHARRSRPRPWRPARRACGSSSGWSTGRRRGSPTTGACAVVMDRCTAIEHRKLRGR